MKSEALALDLAVLILVGVIARWVWLDLPRVAHLIEGLMP